MSGSDLLARYLLGLVLVSASASAARDRRLLGPAGRLALRSLALSALPDVRKVPLFLIASPIRTVRPSAAPLSVTVAGSGVVSPRKIILAVSRPLFPVDFLRPTRVTNRSRKA